MKCMKMNEKKNRFMIITSMFEGMFNSTLMDNLNV